VRVLVKVQLPVEKANEAVKAGTLAKTIQAMMQQHEPEAAYFLPRNGKRTAIFGLDMEAPRRCPR
jgi:hypothetical protein